MLVLEVLVALAVLAGVAMFAAGRFDGSAEEIPDDPDIGVPDDRPLRSDDVPALRFRMAIRGYRMSDVDAAMAAVEESLRLAESRDQPATASETAASEPIPSASEPGPPFEPAPPLDDPFTTPVPRPRPTDVTAPADSSAPAVTAVTVVPAVPAEPAEVPTAEQPSTDAEQKPLSELEAEQSAEPPPVDSEHEQTPGEPEQAPLPPGGS